eukprot:gene29463-5810_t
MQSLFDASVDQSLRKAIELYRLDPMHKGEKVKMMFSGGFQKFMDSKHGEPFRQFSLVSAGVPFLNVRDYMQFLSKKWCVVCMYHDRRMNVVECKAVTNSLAACCLAEFDKYLITQKFIIEDW